MLSLKSLPLACVIVGWLTPATARGLRDGTLLAPVPVAMTQAA